MWGALPWLSLMSRTKPPAMAPRDDVPGDCKADLFLRAGIARIDNVFRITQRQINGFVRLIGTSSGHHAVWHG